MFDRESFINTFKIALKLNFGKEIEEATDF